MSAETLLDDSHHDNVDARDRSITPLDPSRSALQEIQISVGNSNGVEAASSQEGVRDNSNIIQKDLRAISNERMIRSFHSQATRQQRCDAEIGIVEGHPAIFKIVQQRFKPNYRHVDNDRHIEEIILTCRSLEFGWVKFKILAHLASRQGLGGTLHEVQPTWTMTDEGSLVDAILVIGDQSAHAKILKAYAQITLFTMVQKGGKHSPHSEGAGSNNILKEHVIMKSMAESKAATMSPQQKTRYMKTYRIAYHAGEKWTRMCESFDGNGIVLVFAAVGTSTSIV